MDHFIHQRVLKTYKASKAWRILMAVIVPPLVALSIFGAILPFFSDDPFFVANTALLTTIFGILAISSICGLITMFVFRIEVYANGMRQVELFRSKALLFTKYKSYRIIPTGLVKTIVFEPVLSGDKKMGISMVMENVEDFTALLESKFNDAVNEAVKTEDERISRSIPLEKADKFPQVLKYAKAWSFVLNVLAGIIFFMALFYPEPPDMFMWALTFIPVAAIISIKLFKGIIRLSGTIGSSYPQMTMALLFCSMGLFVRSLFDTNPLNYENLLPVGALASMIFAIFCLLFVKEVREKSSNIIFAAVVSLLFGFSTAAHYNEQLDSSDPELYQAEVLDKQKTSDEAGGYCVTLAAWGPHPGQNDQNIDKALFDRLKVGDKVSVYLMEGRFKVPWVDIK